MSDFRHWSLRVRCPRWAHCCRSAIRSFGVEFGRTGGLQGPGSSPCSRIFLGGLVGAKRKIELSYQRNFKTLRFEFESPKRPIAAYLPTPGANGQPRQQALRYAALSRLLMLTTLLPRLPETIGTMAFRAKLSSASAMKRV